MSPLYISPLTSILQTTYPQKRLPNTIRNCSQSPALKPMCREHKSLFTEQTYQRRIIILQFLFYDGPDTMALRCQNSLENGFIFLQVAFLQIILLSFKGFCFPAIFFTFLQIFLLSLNIHSNIFCFPSNILFLLSFKYFLLSFKYFFAFLQIFFFFLLSFKYFFALLHFFFTFLQIFLLSFNIYSNIF